ncbi:MAG: site-specific DNA-methyltransferase [Bacilli bacterium]
MAEKLEMMSSNIIQENIDYIASKFPNALKEVMENGKLVKKIDFDILKQELSTILIDDRQERYQMTWPDKKKSILLANSRINATLRPIKEKSVDFDNTKNLYIEGDNLDVLKLLRETYLGKIKMIYIDPPYNTGNDFIYEDDFSNSEKDYLSMSGQYDEQGNRVVQNTDSNGRFHTDWLNMIFPRLRLAKDLMTPDGLIFISINDVEYANLRKVCDEIFTANNFVTTFIWEKTQHFGRQAKNYYSNADYILCYSNGLITDRINELLVERINSDLLDAPLYNASNNAKVLTFPVGKVKFNLKDGVYTDSTSSDYKLINPVTVKNGVNVNDFSLEFRSRWSNQTVKEEIAKGATFWVKTENFAVRAIYGDGKTSRVAPRQIIFTNSSNKMLTTSRFEEKIGTSENASLALNKLMGKPVFSYPKPVSLIKYFISLLFNEKTESFIEDGIVLDFFSGSGTTAQAIMEYNQVSKSRLKYIMVQLPENLDESIKYAKNPATKEMIQNAIDLCDQLGVEHELTNIGQERIRRAGTEIKKEAKLINAKLDVGFRVLKLDSSNMNEVYYNPNQLNQNLLDQLVGNVKEDRTALDLLFQVMLELGIELSAKIEEKELNGKTYFVVNENDIVACFDNGIDDDLTKELAKIKPIYAVFKDSSFTTDSANINCEQIFKSISPSTTIKVI